MSSGVLLECLHDAQQIGAISPGGLDAQLVQATGFFFGLSADLEARVCDLGSGGGLPALPLALAYPNTRWVLVEAWERRADLLRRSVRRLGLVDRVTVRAARAEVVGRSDLRGAFDMVTARSFGPAAVTLECAAPLLRLGGEVRLSVRGTDLPWPADALAGWGLGAVTNWTRAVNHYRGLVQVERCPGRWPRRVGVPERRPIFR